MSATVRHNSDAFNRFPLVPRSTPSQGGKLSETDDTRALRAPVLKTDKEDLVSVALEPHWAAAIDVATD
ncbi:MAG TPA: hypothetical protein VFH73_07555 [Polyangia bacterium]|jgi:hypothetical protein|nr:hypothetical protein [Polyangia bacterium]